MKKIVSILIIFMIILSFCSSSNTHTSAKENFGIFMEWETPLEDNVSFTPCVSKDGSAFGISKSDKIKSEDLESSGKLTCIKNGEIDWEGSEEFGFTSKLMPARIWDKYVYASGFLASEIKDSEEPKCTFICYTLQGKKTWQVDLSLGEEMPGWALRNGKIYIVAGSLFKILDAKTGKLDKEHELPTTPELFGEMSKPKQKITIKVLHDFASGTQQKQKTYNIPTILRLKDLKKEKADFSTSPESNFFGNKNQTHSFAPAMQKLPSSLSGTDVQEYSSNFVNFIEDKMLLCQTDQFAVFSIDTKDTLAKLWSKSSGDGDLITIQNFLFVINANNKSILYMNKKKGIQKLDNNTGATIWEIKQEKVDIESTTYFANFNENNVVIASDTGLKCCSMKDGKKVWKNTDAQILFPGHITNKHIISNMGVFNIYNIADGKLLAEEIVDGGISLSYISEDSVYVDYLESTTIAKFTFCAPCQCDCTIAWSGGKDTQDVVACPTTETKLEILLKNNNDKNPINFKLKCSSRLVSLEKTSFNIKAKQEEMVEVFCKIPIEMETSYKITINIEANCSKTATLTLNIKKGVDCKEPLKKIWEKDPGTSRFEFNDNLIITRMNYEKPEGIFECVDIKTGETIWEFDTFSVEEGLEKLSDIIDLKTGLLIRAYGTNKDEKSVYCWYLLDGKTGTVVWKRTNGQPWNLLLDIGLSKNEKVELFDYDTGKTVCGPIMSKQDCVIEQYLSCENKFILQLRNIDSDLLETICFDSKGKQLWKSSRIFDTWVEKKGLYSMDISSDADLEKEKDKNHIVSRINVETGKSIWSVKVYGPWFGVSEFDNTSVVICFDSIQWVDFKTGKLIWNNDYDSGIRWVNTDFKKLYIGLFTNNAEVNKFQVVDIKSREVLYKTTIEDYQQGWYMPDRTTLFGKHKEENDEGEEEEYLDVYRLDVSTDKCKLLWKTSDKSNFWFEFDSERIMYLYKDRVSWYMSGELVGEAQIDANIENDIALNEEKVDTYNGNVFVKKSLSLMSFDEKTSEMNWIISESPDLENRFTIQDVYYTDYSTPVMISGHVFTYQDGKLICYETK